MTCFRWQNGLRWTIWWWKNSKNFRISFEKVLNCKTHIYRTQNRWKIRCGPQNVDTYKKIHKNQFENKRNSTFFHSGNLNPIAERWMKAKKRVELNGIKIVFVTENGADADEEVVLEVVWMMRAVRTILRPGGPDDYRRPESARLAHSECSTV